MEYFTSNNISCLQKLGFRAEHSTKLAALKLANHLITEMDKCNIPRSIYIDLSKAFNVLNICFWMLVPCTLFIRYINRLTTTKVDSTYLG